MSVTLVLAGTRKGCFVLESDAERHSWTHARAVLRELADLPRRARCGFRRALRSRRQRVARRRRLAQSRPGRDLGALERRPELRRGRGAQALEGLGPVAVTRAPAGRRRGLRRLREPRRRLAPGRCSARSTTSPGARPGTSPRISRRGTSGCPVSCPTPRTPPASGPWSRASASSRRPTTARPGRRATAGCAPTGRSRIPRSATACTSS